MKTKIIEKYPLISYNETHRVPVKIQDDSGRIGFTSVNIYYPSVAPSFFKGNQGFLGTIDLDMFCPLYDTIKTEDVYWVEK